MAPLRRLLGLALAPLLLLAATACSETPPQEKHVEQAVRDYYEAYFRGDYRTTYLMLDRESRESCGRRIVRVKGLRSLFIGRVVGIKSYIHDVTDIRVDGGTALVKVDIRDRNDVVYWKAEPLDTVLHREGGRWRINVQCEPRS